MTHLRLKPHWILGIPFFLLLSCTNDVPTASSDGPDISFSIAYDACPDCRPPIPEEVDRIERGGWKVEQAGMAKGGRCWDVWWWMRSNLSPWGWNVSDDWAYNVMGWTAAHKNDHTEPHFIISAQRVGLDFNEDDIARSIIHEVAHHLWGYDEMSATALAMYCIGAG